MTEPFDVCGPLPTGVTVLEASAGTGKTWTIAALAARYVAEGTHPRAGEAAEAEHQLAYGPLTFDELLGPRPRQDEHGPWWDEQEPRRFGRWARRLWDGLLQHEHVEDR